MNGSNWVSRVASALWVCLGLAVVVIVSGFESVQVFGIGRLGRGDVLRLLGVVVVVLAFVLLHQLAKAAWRYSPPARQLVPAEPTIGEAFPSPSTNLAFAWLMVFIIVSVSGLLLAAKPPTEGWLAEVSRGFAVFGDNQINEAFVTLFGAGIGSAITTLLAFLRHATTRKDFDRAQLAWYVARPLMGMLLGLVFYFLIRGGLMLTLGSTDVSTEDLNVWGLAAIGALVGLFSKNAIDKLREIFHVVFQTEGDVRQRLGDASGDARQRLLELLPDSVKSILMFGTSAQLEEALRTLPDDTKNNLRQELPSGILTVLEPFLGANLLQRLRSLPSEQRQRLFTALPERAQEAFLQGDNESLEQALREQTHDEWTTLQAESPPEARAMLLPHLGIDLLMRLRGLSESDQEAVYHELPEAMQAAWRNNDEAGLIRALNALDETEKRELSAGLPAAAQQVFLTYLDTAAAPEADSETASDTPYEAKTED